MTIDVDSDRLDEIELGELDASQRLALVYAPRHRRQALAAAWALDARMRRLFLNARDPMLAEIKLAWWQERLEALGHERTPDEPLLQALAEAASGSPSLLAALAELPGAWRSLGDDRPFPQEALHDYARGRGGGMMRLVGEILRAPVGGPAETAGEGWALFDLAAHLTDVELAERVAASALDRFSRAGRLAWPRAMRPAGMMVELARGDALAGRRTYGGSPSRVARMAWHALTGR